MPHAKPSPNKLPSRSYDHCKHGYRWESAGMALIKHASHVLE